MDRETAGAIADNGYSLPFDPAQQKIELHGDGSCHFATFASVSEPVRGPIAASCHWFLTQFKPPHVMVKIDGGSFTEWYSVGERNGELFLWQYAADPDMGRLVIYRRTSSASAPYP